MKVIFIGMCVFWVLGFFIGIYVLPQYNSEIGAILSFSLLGFLVFIIWNYIKAKVK
jgi:hypothetical protein